MTIITIAIDKGRTKVDFRKNGIVGVGQSLNVMAVGEYRSFDNDPESDLPEYRSSYGGP